MNNRKSNDRSEAKSRFNDFLDVYQAFQGSGIENPLLETLYLFDLLSEGALGDTNLQLLEQEKIDLLELANKREKGMPLEKIIGLASFMGHNFFCSPETFIPKKQTEILVRIALNFLKKKQQSENNLTIIDMAAGCGNIAITLAMNFDNARVFASDISPEAVMSAKRNVNKFRVQGRVSIFCGDLFAPFRGLGCEEMIDLVVCNPPYIPTGSLHKLPKKITDFEPKVALNGGPFGIDFHRRLITDTLSMLKPHGVLIFEIGIGQQGLVSRLFKKKDGYEDVQHHSDGADIRVVSASKK